MGVQAFADVKAKEHVSNDSKYNAQVKRVGERIAANVGREIPISQWEYVVLDSDEVNAFALPGGKVAVYTGLLRLVKSDDELACVMGHEIAHVTSRHGAERTSQNEAVQTIGGLGAAYMDYKNADPKTQSVILAGYGVGTNLLGLLPYSRLHESEADSIGLRFAAQAGYDPHAAVTFWKRMSEASAAAGKQNSGLLAKFTSTHPLDADRIANLESLVPKYMPVYEAAKQRYQ